MPDDENNVHLWPSMHELLIWMFEVQIFRQKLKTRNWRFQSGILIYNARQYTCQGGSESHPGWATRHRKRCKVLFYLSYQTLIFTFPKSQVFCLFRFKVQISRLRGTKGWGTRRETSNRSRNRLLQVGEPSSRFSTVFVQLVAAPLNISDPQNIDIGVFKFGMTRLHRSLVSASSRSRVTIRVTLRKISYIFVN